MLENILRGLGSKNRVRDLNSFHMYNSITYLF